VQAATRSRLRDSQRLARRDAQLPEHVAQVPLDGARADVHLAADFLVGVALASQPSQLRFLARERCEMALLASLWGSRSGAVTEIGQQIAPAGSSSARRDC
jgi:hypothetical protein